MEAWASPKSFQRKDDPTPPSDGDPGNPTVNFHGERRSNATHESTKNPEARLAAITGLELRLVSGNLDLLLGEGKVRRLTRGRLERYELTLG